MGENVVGRKGRMRHKKAAGRGCRKRYGEKGGKSPSDHQIEIAALTIGETKGN